MGTSIDVVVFVVAADILIAIPELTPAMVRLVVTVPPLFVGIVGSRDTLVVTAIFVSRGRKRKTILNEKGIMLLLTKIPEMLPPFPLRSIQPMALFTL
jgi:hypothetical protein